MATIGENIKRVRNKLGLTQDDLVRKSGVKHTTLTKIESNVVVKPSLLRTLFIFSPIVAIVSMYCYHYL